jgi:hypothetical protein
LAKSTDVALASSGAPVEDLAKRKAGADVLGAMRKRRLLMEAAF